MSLPDEPATAGKRCPERLRPALDACAAGEVPPNIALLRVLIEAVDPHEAESALDAAHAAARGPARARLAEAITLCRGNPQAFETVKRVLRGVEHGGTAPDVDAGLAAWAAAFDRMAAVSPEGSVALYSLGNPEMLRAATDEIVDRLEGWGLLGPDRSALDLGCGIGRLTAALSPRIGHVTGIDISGAMIARARERCADLANVTLQVSSGRDLSAFADASFDLVLAADVFPYLVQTGPELAAAHVHEAGRVLRPGGSLVILNMSYRADPDRDRAEVEALAEAAGLRLVRHGTRDFTLWDASTFRLDKP
jgi:ubiquinone/menaquinone biosynthesis C-methylase UbiE